MGHHQLERMARTGPWRQVVQLMGHSAGAGWRTTASPGKLAEVAQATLAASFAGLERAKDDPGLGCCLYLLAEVVRAARADDFKAALATASVVEHRAVTMGWGDVAVAVSVGTADEPFTAWELVCGFSEAIDRRMAEARCRTDIGEMAQLAAAESLNFLCVDRSESLYGSTEETVRSAPRALSTEKGFGRL